MERVGRDGGCWASPRRGRGTEGAPRGRGDGCSELPELGVAGEDKDKVSNRCTTRRITAGRRPRWAGATPRSRPDRPRHVRRPRHALLPQARVQPTQARERREARGAPEGPDGGGGRRGAHVRARHHRRRAIHGRAQEGGLGPPDAGKPSEGGPRRAGRRAQRGRRGRDPPERRRLRHDRPRGAPRLLPALRGRHHGRDGARELGRSRRLRRLLHVALPLEGREGIPSSGSSPPG